MVKLKFQAIEMVIIYAPDTMLRKHAFDAFKRVENLCFFSALKLLLYRNLFAVFSKSGLCFGP